MKKTQQFAATGLWETVLFWRSGDKSFGKKLYSPVTHSFLKYRADFCKAMCFTAKERRFLGTERIHSGFLKDVKQ